MSILDGQPVHIPTGSLRRAFVLLIGAAAMSACGGSKLSQMIAAPTTVQITIKAADKINVDSRERSTPLVVRYYLLKNASAFTSSDFFSLYEKDQQTLGEALVAREEVVLKGGDTKVLEPKDAGEAQVVGVMAAFRDIEHAVWRGTFPLAANKLTAVVITVQDKRLVVSGKVP